MASTISVPLTAIGQPAVGGTVSNPSPATGNPTPVSGGQPTPATNTTPSGTSGTSNAAHTTLTTATPAKTNALSPRTKQWLSIAKATSKFILGLVGTLGVAWAIYIGVAGLNLQKWSAKNDSLQACLALRSNSSYCDMTIEAGVTAPPIWRRGLPIPAPDSASLLLRKTPDVLALMIVLTVASVALAAIFIRPRMRPLTQPFLPGDSMVRTVPTTRVTLRKPIRESNGALLKDTKLEVVTTDLSHLLKNYLPKSLAGVWVKRTRLAVEQGVDDDAQREVAYWYEDHDRGIDDRVGQRIGILYESDDEEELIARNELGDDDRLLDTDGLEAGRLSVVRHGENGKAYLFSEYDLEDLHRKLRGAWEPFIHSREQSSKVFDKPCWATSYLMVDAFVAGNSKSPVLQDKFLRLDSAIQKRIIDDLLESLDRHSYRRTGRAAEEDEMSEHEFATILDYYVHYTQSLQPDETDSMHLEQETVVTQESSPSRDGARSTAAASPPSKDGRSSLAGAGANLQSASALIGIVRRLGTANPFRRRREPSAVSSRPGRTGPARAYQVGNTILVEDEDGEVIKKYDVPESTEETSAQRKTPSSRLQALLRDLNSAIRLRRSSRDVQSDASWMDRLPRITERSYTWERGDEWVDTIPRRSLSRSDGSPEDDLPEDDLPQDGLPEMGAPKRMSK